MSEMLAYSTSRGADRNPAPVGSTRHINELQSIRGLAALLVAFAHPLSYYKPPEWYLPVWSIVNSQAAVTIFFILSGFVLTRSLSHQSLDSSTVRNYYIKRLFRIYPALWFMSGFALIYVSFIHYRFPDPLAAEWFQGRFQADRYTPIHITASFVGMLAYLSPPVWTIFVELFASALLPFAVWLLLRSKGAFTLLMAACLVVGVAFNGQHLYYHIDVYLIDFLLGAALTALPTRPVLALGKVVPLKLLMTVAALFMLFTRTFVITELYDFWLAQWEAVLAAFIIFVFGRCGVTSTILRSRAFVWLGDISYSLYIMHFTIMCLYAKAILLLAPSLITVVGGGFASVFLAVITVLTALPVAGWTYLHVELPGIRLGKRLIASWSPPPSGKAQMT